MDIKETNINDVLPGIFPVVGSEPQGVLDAKEAFIVHLEGNARGVQGIPNNLIVEDFELFHDALFFDDLVGKNLADLDDNVESVMDTGNALVFNFMGGGSLILNGVTGYNDFTSLSMDYNIEILG
ncbi:MAG: hypothetical protein ABFQ95_00850 [Pseudomonadota bacterium]